MYLYKHYIIHPYHNMSLSKACGPPPTEAVYTELSTATAAIQKHAKCNRYALIKRDTKLSYVVYMCDRYSKLESKPRNPDIYESRRRSGSRSKKCNCRMKVALKQDKCNMGLA